MDTAPFSLTFIEIPRAPRFLRASFSALSRSSSAFRSSCSLMSGFIGRTGPARHPSIEEGELAVPAGRAPEGGGLRGRLGLDGLRLSPLRTEPQLLAGGAEEVVRGVRVHPLAPAAYSPARVVELPAAHLAHPVEDALRPQRQRGAD